MYSSSGIANELSTGGGKLFPQYRFHVALRTMAMDRSTKARMHSGMIGKDAAAGSFGFMNGSMIHMGSLMGKCASTCFTNGLMMLEEAAQAVGFFDGVPELNVVSVC